MIAQIAVSSAVFAIDKPYSYGIPNDLKVYPGMRVTVPFGRGNRRSEGIVLSVAEGDSAGLKFIEQVLDQEPILDEKSIRLAAFVRERYFCTFYDAIRSILPTGLWYYTTEIYEVVQTPDDLHAFRNKRPMAAEILLCLTELGGRGELSFLKKQFPDTEALEAGLKYLTSKGYLHTNVDMERRAKDKTEKIISLAVSAEEAMKYALTKQKSAPLQYQVLSLLTSVGQAGSKEVCYYTGASTATLRRLQELGYLCTEDCEVFRTPYPNAVPKAEPLVLSRQQNEVFSSLESQMKQETPGSALLYGVTGSGKTAVYIRLIASALEQGKSALFLVPEIALTPQFVSRLMSHFGEQVAVIHSGLRMTERYDEWKRIKNGMARVILGTRSAVFAPADNLGLIIVDEEQEHTYKSENTPRYHAREVALYRGLKERALVLFGSATPSMETMYQAKSGQHSLYRLSGRYNGKELPKAELIDMKKELRQGNGSSISQPLRQAMRETFEAGKQSILFLNRRGAAKQFVCVDCGDIPSCPRCSVSLTYHTANQRLMCHYCGYSQPAEVWCDCCGGHRKPVGSGTQRVEQELGQLFPDKDVLRMDADTISASHNHETVLKQFEKEKVPVLLGTQMVTKGLDFENVTLVGVIDADQMLYSGSYRASENTFSMIAQVIGRSGRGADAGRAIIQTMTPENNVLQLAAEQAYDEFYDLESAVRQMQHCPPFGDLFQISFVGPFEDRTCQSAMRFRQRLKEVLTGNQTEVGEYRILGPAPAVVFKVNNTYRYRLILGCRNRKPIRLMLAQLLREFSKEKQNRGVTAFVDVNPYD